MKIAQRYTKQFTKAQVTDYGINDQSLITIGSSIYVKEIKITSEVYFVDDVTKPFFNSCGVVTAYDNNDYDTPVNEQVSFIANRKLMTNDHITVTVRVNTDNNTDDLRINVTVELIGYKAANL